MDTGRTSRHQDSEEQQGYPPQTDSDCNKHLQLKLCDLHRGREDKGEKETHREMREERHKLDECGSESEDRKEEETGEKGRQPEMA